VQACGLRRTLFKAGACRQKHSSPMAARSSTRVRRTRVQDDSDSDSSNYDGSESGDDDTGKSGGASAQKWVQCDKCGQWRRLSGITDLKSLPKRWFCKLNPDLRYNDCKIPVSASALAGALSSLAFAFLRRPPLFILPTPPSPETGIFANACASRRNKKTIWNASART
jgi:hypothetical protein